MELSSHVKNNMNDWLESGLINTEAYNAILQLMSDALDDAYNAGSDSAEDEGYDRGWDDGYQTGKSEYEGQRDEWFEQGWAECLIEHGIEE